MDDWLKEVDNYNVLQAFLKAKAIIGRHSRIYASISGGADSDIVLDMCERVRGNKPIKYVWFNTGLEYQATKNHLDYLEKRYRIEIERIRPKKPVPYCVHEYGVPFKSKFISDIKHHLLSAFGVFNFMIYDIFFLLIVHFFAICIYIFFHFISLMKIKSK